MSHHRNVYHIKGTSQQTKRPLCVAEPTISHHKLAWNAI